MRAALEALLRDRKLDVTLTRADIPPDRLAPTGDAELDAALGGGLRRGHLSEIVGPATSGRTTAAVRALAAATARGEAAALVDACDTFDPESAAGCGVDLSRLLWVRTSAALGTGLAPSASGGSGPADTEAARALKAFSLILQAGNFGLVVLDLADVAASVVRRFPWTTWMRVARAIEGSDTVALLVGQERIARSPLGVTVALEGLPVRWLGPASARARLFAGVAPRARVVRAR
jgi:hypothetical protein